MRDPRTLIRCPECGDWWDGHDPACRGHKYKPPIRRDVAGRDVTDMPGLWNETDTFHFPVGRWEHLYYLIRSTFIEWFSGHTLRAAWRRAKWIQGGGR